MILEQVHLLRLPERLNNQHGRAGRNSAAY